MSRTAMNGPKSRAPPQWRVIVTRITQYAGPRLTRAMTCAKTIFRLKPCCTGAIRCRGAELFAIDGHLCSTITRRRLSFWPKSTSALANHTAGRRELFCATAPDSGG